MQKHLIISFAVFAFFFAGCESTKVQSQQINNQSKKETVIEIPKYSEWRYQGFGQKIPEWFDYSVTNDTKNVYKFINNKTDLSVENISIISGKAENGDQAEQFIKQNKKNNTYIDSFWAKPTEYDVNDNNPYIWVIILKTN